MEQSYLFPHEVRHKSLSLQTMRLSPSHKIYIPFASPCQHRLLERGWRHTVYLEYGGWLINGAWVEQPLIPSCSALVFVAVLFLLSCIKKKKRLFSFLKIGRRFSLFYVAVPSQHPLYCHASCQHSININSNWIELFMRGGEKWESTEI